MAKKTSPVDETISLQQQLAQLEANPSRRINRRADEELVVMSRSRVFPSGL